MNEFYVKNNTVRCRALDSENVIHGFSTRNGGVSVLPYTKSLNLCRGRGDSDGVVDENRRLFASYAGFDPAALVTANQIHSANVVYADGKTAVYDGADALVTDKPGVILGVKTADCQPVLFLDGKNGIVAACHAGWRGTVNGIAAKTVDAMVRLGADRKTTVAVLGPCIGKCCFEVKDDFTKSVREADPELLRFVSDGHADIRAMNEYVLIRAGILKENIYVCPDCTCCAEDKYYSHRRQKGLRGTMLNVIGLRGYPDGGIR